MKVLLISFGVLEYDGRLRELLGLCSRLGSVRLVCCSIERNDLIKVKKESSPLSARSYSRFVLRALVYALFSRYDLLFVDNMFAAPVGLAVLALRPKKRIVQDVRELYLPEDMPSAKSKLVSFLERALMRRSDVTIAANRERKEIMLERRLVDTPSIVFENTRTLRTVAGVADSYREKYHSDFGYDFNVIATGGLARSRRTLELVGAVAELGPRFGLYLAGGGSSEDEAAVNRLIEEAQILNVHVLGRLPAGELQYVVSSCDIGVVNYGTHDLNNLYCASGKIYEYLGEGLALVCSDNPPLERFIRESGAGIASTDFASALQEVSAGLASFRAAGRNYMLEVDSSQDLLRVATEMHEALASAKRT